MSQNTEAFCCAPFSQVCLHPTGEITPCCFNQEIILGNQNNSFEEVWNGRALQVLRQEFLSNNIFSCRNYINSLGCQKYYQRFSNLIEKKTIIDSKPLCLDIRLNGQCNLSCIMCNVYTQPNGLYEGSEFWTECLKLVIPKIKELWVLGGEPFIQKDTFKLIDYVLEKNPDCIWRFETNGNFNCDYVFEYLRKIIIGRIGISVDSLNNETYRFIRKKGDLNIVLSNLKKLKEFKRNNSKSNFEIALTMCILERNYKEIPDYMKFCKENGFTYDFHFVSYPESLSLHKLPVKTKKEILGFLTANITDIEEIKILAKITRPLHLGSEKAINRKQIIDKIDIKYNWIKNGNFHMGLENWELIGDVKCIESMEFNYAVVNGDNFDFRGLTQQINISQEVYMVILSGRMKSEEVISAGNEWENSRMTIEFLNETNELVGGYQPLAGGIRGTNDWQHFSRSYICNQNATKIKILLNQYRAKGISYFTDINVVLLDKNLKPLPTHSLST